MVFKRGNVTLEENEGCLRGVLGTFVCRAGECCLCIDKGCRGGFQVCFGELCVLFLFLRFWCFFAAKISYIVIIL